MSYVLNDHIAPRFSDLELRMVEHLPPGGNWKNIPASIPSQRLKQIRESGGRTTYYGRLEFDMPSYTISTYFNRLGNGCHVHPDQNRLISIREGARLQSFQDHFRFCGSRAYKYKQIGNAVPPLLSRAIASCMKEGHTNHKTLDLFSGAGGLSEGFRLEGFEPIGAIEMIPIFHQTYVENSDAKYRKNMLLGDITKPENSEKLIRIGRENQVGVIMGGPPCQGFSTAGWRNENDPRNDLVHFFIEMVRKIEPECFLIENVPGILSMKNGAVADFIESAAKDMGYSIDVKQLKADAYGVPQRRKRVFFIGSSKGKVGLPSPLFSYEDTRLPFPVTVREAIAGLPPLNPAEGSENITADLSPSSAYQRFLMGQISFSDFYRDVKSDKARNERLRKLNPKKSGLSSPD